MKIAAKEKRYKRHFCRRFGNSCYHHCSSTANALKTVAGVTEKAIQHFYFSCTKAVGWLGLVTCHDTRGGSRGMRMGRLPSLKPTTFFIMIFYNSENRIRDIRPFSPPLFCYSSVVKYCFFLSKKWRATLIIEVWIPLRSFYVVLTSPVSSAQPDLRRKFARTAATKTNTKTHLFLYLWIY